MKVRLDIVFLDKDFQVRKISTDLGRGACPYVYALTPCSNSRPAQSRAAAPNSAIY